jgi:hypothetical protein
VGGACSTHASEYITSETLKGRKRVRDVGVNGNYLKEIGSEGMDGINLACCCSCPRGETVSLNCGHQRAFCPSPR